MLPPNLQTPNEVKRYYDSLYQSLIDSGQYSPFLYPGAACGAAIVLLYLLIDHRNSPPLRSLRYPIFAYLVAFQSWCLFTNKARTAAAAYGVGLVSSWGTLWIATIMVMNDCQTDFKRIERTDSNALSRVKDCFNGTTLNGKAVAASPENPHSKEIEMLQASEKLATQGPAQRTGPFIWQSYPSGPFIERLDWVVDLFCSFRGVGWNFETAGVPAIPAQVQSALDGGQPSHPLLPAPPTVSHTGIQRFSDRAQLFAYLIPRLVAGYLFIDLVHVLMHHDPYFWGYTHSRPPPTHLPAVVQRSPALLQAYRLCLCLAAIHAVLNQLFRLGPLVFAGLLGPRALGLRGEAWLNPPDFWGSWRPVRAHGLAGWWGGFWHQTFRFAFATPGRLLLARLGVPPRSAPGRAVAVFAAFFASGCLHAAGSRSQLGDTRPLRGPMCFFLLQAVGIVGQTAAVQWLRGIGAVRRVPAWVGDGVNVGYAVAWMYFTAPLLMDDFAEGGVWLYEPLPVSPLRALGFGAKDDGWYDMWFDLVSWRRGNGWWDTGIAF